jgi:hypothetical protein
MLPEGIAARAGWAGAGWLAEAGFGGGNKLLATWAFAEDMPL